MTRNLPLDRLKGIAVILMVISHVWLFQISASDTLTSIDMAILLASRICAPIFVFSFALVLTQPRRSHLVIRRSSYVLLVALLLSFMMMQLTLAPYSIHILYILLLISILVPILQKLSAQTCLLLTGALFVLHALFNIIAMDMPTWTVLLYGGKLSDNLALSFGLLTLLPYMFMGMYCYKIGDYITVKKASILVKNFFVYGVITFVIEIYFIQNDSIYALASINMLMMSACLYLYQQLMKLPEFDNILLPFGRHVLLVYLLHHLILFSFVLMTGGIVQYGLMMKGEYVVDHSNLFISIATIILLVICFAVANLADYLYQRVELKKAI